MEKSMLTKSVSNPLNAISKIAAVVGAVFVVTGVIQFYKNNIWKPSVSVIGIDWNSGVASVMVNGTEKYVYADTVLGAGGMWGVRFAKPPDSKDVGYSRLELTKNGMAYSVLAQNSTPNV